MGQAATEEAAAVNLTVGKPVQASKQE